MSNGVDFKKISLENRELLNSALAREDALQALSVTRIMLDVVPGEDGMGEEIYAKSVADVEALLSKQCEDIEALQDREAALREELESIKAIVDGYDSPEHAAQVADEMGHQCVTLQQRLTVAEQRDADNPKLISGLVEYADNLLADVNNAWLYAGSTGEPEAHKDEDYAAAINLLSATVSSHE